MAALVATLKATGAFPPGARARHHASNTAWRQSHLAMLAMVRTWRLHDRLNDATIGDMLLVHEHGSDQERRTIEEWLHDWIEGSEGNERGALLS